MRKLLDDLGLRCLSTHNGPNALSPDGLQKAIDLNPCSLWPALSLLPQLDPISPP
jgi:hypothetical protein